jgi:nucleoside permease NupC
MSTRARKLIGAVVLIGFVALYAMAAMALAQSRPLQEASAVAKTLGYLVLGLAWTLPAAALIKWMERPGRDDPPRSRRT